MTEFASRIVQSVEARVFGECPVYLGTGGSRCTGGCQDEPLCITGAPEGGWESEPSVQYNAPNPILVAFRTDPEPDADTARFWIAQMDDYSTATDAHIDHARRVLTRLANLTDKEH